MSRIARWAVALLAILASGAAAQEAIPLGADAERVRLEAVNLLQGVDSAPFLDTARVRLVAEALRTIRRQLPQLADIPAGPDQSFLILWAADSVKGAFVERSGAQHRAGANSDIWTAPVTHVGIPAIDSLNRVFDVARAEARYSFGRTELELHFGRPVNVPVVARSYERVPQVAAARPELYLGDGSWIALIAKGRLLHYVFARGGGDCPAGCTEWDYYYVTYDTLARSVGLERQVLQGDSWAEPIAYWDVPTRYSINPYPTVDSLYAGLREEHWWYRQHAVYVLGMLLGTETRPWHGAGEQSEAHFTALKEAALARRRESYEALIARLGDADPDVARLAHAYLQELSGRTLPGGAAGVSQWRQWLSESP